MRQTQPHDFTSHYVRISTISHSQDIASLVLSSTHGALLLLGRRERLQILEMGLGIDELINLLDLEEPIIVGSNVCDDN